MTYIASPIVTKLEAFNKDGIHCGYAILRDGCLWHVRSAVDGVYADTREQAENWLRAHGAETIEER